MPPEQAFSHMNGMPDYKDARAQGGNPCLEQTLESYGQSDIQYFV